MGIIISPHELIKSYNNGEFSLRVSLLARAWENCYLTLGKELADSAYGEILLTVGLPSSGKTTATREYLDSYDIIFDGDFTKKFLRSAIINIAKGAGWDTDCLWVDAPYNVCRNRNHRSANGQHIPFEIFKNISRMYSEPKEYEGFRDIIKVPGIKSGG